MHLLKWNIKNHPRVALSLVFDAKFRQYVFHQTPFGDRRLQQISAYKSGKPQPILIDVNRQQQTN